jgi:hypothetical protein
MRINVNEMDYTAEESTENTPTFILENITNSTGKFLQT